MDRFFSLKPPSGLLSMETLAVALDESGNETGSTAKCDRIHIEKAARDGV